MTFDLKSKIKSHPTLSKICTVAYICTVLLRLLVMFAFSMIRFSNFINRVFGLYFILE